LARVAYESLGAQATQSGICYSDQRLRCRDPAIDSPGRGTSSRHHVSARRRRRKCHIRRLPWGNRTRCADASGVYTTVYDAKSRVTRTSNADGKRVTYSYDAIDRRTRLIDPDNGRISYVYDAKNRISGVINPQGKRTSWSYDAADRLRRQRHGNGSLVTQIYDAANQETGLINATSAGVIVNRFTYSYDNAGRGISDWLVLLILEGLGASSARETRSSRTRRGVQLSRRPSLQGQ
jgi:YD repeat-containing protein